MSQTSDPVITISLLDPVVGLAARTWEFDGAAVIRIGRAATNDVVLGDERVSRAHAEFTRTDEGWNITPLGQNGVAVSGRAITGATPVADATVLRLAANGPYLEFRVGRKRNNLAEKLADEQRWAAIREREKEDQRAAQTDATEVDFLQRRERQKPAN